MGDVVSWFVKLIVILFIVSIILSFLYVLFRTGEVVGNAEPIFSTLHTFVAGEAASLVIVVPS